MKKMILLLILIVVATGTIFPQTSTPPTLGDGSFGNPYQIATLDNLYWLSQTSSEWVAGKYFEQTANIDASATSSWDSGAGFSPIGNLSITFKGSYDGKDFTIDGLTINRSSDDFIGIFGSVNSATITNLGLTDVNIVGSNYVGGLVGWSYDPIIEHCYSTGSVSGNNDVGGLAGDYREEFNSSSRIYDCYSSATVDGSTSIGGLVGDSRYYINNCYSTGAVTGELWVGGLVGLNGSEAVNYSYSTGLVSGNQRVGGLVGECGGQIIDSYSRGDVVRLSGTNTFIGAFCGYPKKVERCYSTGSVIYTGATDPTDKGFLGVDNGTYVNNFWDSDVSNQLTATGATAKTTAEMKNVATFTDLTTVGLSAPVWDFETNPNDDALVSNRWDITPLVAAPKVRALGKTMDIGDNYPFLSWQNGTDTALPIELSLFTVENDIEGVICKWTTESEYENLGFLLERKTEGTAWTEIVSYKIDSNLIGQGTTSSYTNYEYLDMLVQPNTTYEYRLADVDHNGVVTYHSVRTVTVGNTVQSSLIKEFTVLPAYPNPFNPSTKIRYGLDMDSKVTIKIYDITGKLINTLQDENQTQGWHSVIWNGTDLKNNKVPAGIYLSKITSNSITKTTKLMLLK